MTTLQKQLETADLSDGCKVDLMNHMEQLELQSSTLPKKNVTSIKRGLPDATHQDTISHGGKSVDGSIKNQTRSDLMQKKMTQQENHESVAAATSLNDTEYFKTANSTYRNQPNQSDPFRDQRDRTKLSSKDEDFVHRYAEAMAGSEIERPVKDDPATAAATEAYIKAFRSYKGRDPTKKELEEVNRLHFGVDSNGNVGVIQKPHSCNPHYHYSNCKKCTTECSCQVYKSEVPQVRGARDQFPGPVPVWSSTKNTSTLVGGDMHQPGQHYTNGASQKRAAMNTMTGTK